MPYRYFKPFTARYIDANGVETKRTYVMYVRAAGVKKICQIAFMKVF
ncbi:hypothetical protein [Campylobacter devanensis]|nr:hypothetical protein [Campylobacter sp. P0106]